MLIEKWEDNCGTQAPDMRRCLPDMEPDMRHGESFLRAQ